MRLPCAREPAVRRSPSAGRTNAEVAGTLVVEEATIRTQMKRILSKLDLRDGVHAVILAYETGLVRPGEGTGR